MDSGAYFAGAVSYTRRMFMKLATGFNAIKRFSSSTLRPNKLDCMFLASIIQASLICSSGAQQILDYPEKTAKVKRSSLLCVNVSDERETFYPFYFSQGKSTSLSSNFEKDLVSIL